MANEVLMTKLEVQAYLRISHDTLHRIMKTHGLPYIKLEKKVLFKKSDIDKFLEAHLIK
jgi:excisionase family DNA binding protein